jgi:hypothetical protein
MKYFSRMLATSFILSVLPTNLTCQEKVCIWDKHTMVDQPWPGTEVIESIPRGTYTDSCRNCWIMHPSHLSCECLDKNRDFHKSLVDLHDCNPCENEIINQDGQLKCSKNYLFSLLDELPHSLPEEELFLWLDSRQKRLDSFKERWDKLRIETIKTTEKVGDDAPDPLWLRAEIRYKQLVVEMYNKLCEMYGKRYIEESFDGDPLENKDLIFRRYNEMDFNWVRKKAAAIRERRYEADHREIQAFMDKVVTPIVIFIAITYALCCCRC